MPSLIRRILTDFGGVQQLREEARDARGLRPLEDLVLDCRFGSRALVRRPGFLTVVLLTLGIGIGGSTAIFGAVNGILLTPLPYPHADRLVAVWQLDRRSGDRQEVAPANFLDWRERSRAFEPLTAMEPYGLDWLSPDGPTYLATWLVYEGFFEAFGTPPLLGRVFHEDEHTPGRGDVVVLGYRLWQTRFAGASDIVGRVLSLDGRPHTVVGVMPEGFAMPADDIVWAPKILQGWEKDSRTSSFYAVFGRLRDGVTLNEAAADLQTVAEGLSREYPRTNAFVGAVVVSLSDQILGGVREALWLLFGAVVLVLAVVTASVASMQLARAAARGREFAVRAALGAGPGRVARQLIAENLMLAALGASVGFALARVTLEGIRALAPADLPRVEQLRADTAVLLFAVGASLLAVLATGVLPTLVAAKARIQTTLGEAGRGLAGSRMVARMQAVLVVFQCCASLILLVGAGLLMRSFVAVLNEPAGFRADGVAALTVQSWNHYTTASARAVFVREVLDRLSSSPGIRAVGMTSSVPLMDTIGAELAPLTLEGAPPLPEGENPPLVHYTVVAGGFFEALGIPLRAGRLFDARDGASTVPVALVNETFAGQYLADRDPIGKRIILSGSAAGQQPPPVREVIGVVGDVRRFALHEAPRPAVYLPHSQLPTGANAFVVWNDGTPAEALRRIRTTVWQLNPTMAIYRETTLTDLVGASIRDRRFLLVLVSGFALVALVLAAVGIFGLMSYVTAQRTREYGVRLALGAERGELLFLVLRRGFSLVAVGISLGCVGALGLTRTLTGMLYEITPLDPPTFVLAVFVLCTTAMVASLHPAWRAAMTDPIGALREE